jgi:hypothetical protein
MDRVYLAYLEKQLEEGLALARESDLFEILPLGDGPAPGIPNRYLLRYRCKGLVQNRDGEVVVHDHKVVGITFPADYLRHVDPLRVLSWIGPRSMFHPNVSQKYPIICVGRVTPSTTLVELIFRCHHIITWQTLTTREDDALNHDACRWARNHPDRYPVDTRGLKRRALDNTVEERPRGQDGVLAQ